MTYDVRSIANTVLKIAEEQGRVVSNLSLNKIIYFLHVAFLQKTGKPLTSAKIEAWDHGPVYREIYHQFKKFGRDQIKGRARRLDPSTGEYGEVPIVLSPEEYVFIKAQATDLLRLSCGRLVDMSHLRDGPWYAARFGNGRLNPGIEITDDLIRSCLAEQVKH